MKRKLLVTVCICVSILLSILTAYASQDYTTEYVRSDEKILLGYKTLRDHAIFTDKTMILFDRDLVGETKRIHVIPYASISTSVITFKPGKAEILLSLDSGYQLREWKLKDLMEAEDVTGVISSLEGTKYSDVLTDVLPEYNETGSVALFEQALDKFLVDSAKSYSMKKPLGITVLRKREVPDKLWPF